MARAYYQDVKDEQSKAEGRFDEALHNLKRNHRVLTLGQAESKAIAIQNEIGRLVVKLEKDVKALEDEMGSDSTDWDANEEFE